MQISKFNNTTYFTAPGKRGALGATRLASPASTQRVGNQQEDQQIALRFFEFISDHLKNSDTFPFLQPP